MNKIEISGGLVHIAKDADWWRGAVIYQIYPRSFQDSNGDGIGDLAGIADRLPYVASLGVDAIWISPFFKSPMKDFGYDVSDYRDVDPTFGTLADFEKVVVTAHGLGLKVMIDLVLSHTSDQHPWFAESRANRENDKSNWYVWADAKTDGTPPTNWLSIFGGSAWQWDSRRQQYYLHNFLTSQPDLNFHEPRVQDALLDVAQFWIDRGVDGVRLDTINFYFHDQQLRDNPPLAPELRNATIAPQVNPYNHQEHLYDKNRPENIAFLKRLRAVLNPSNAAAVGEVGDAQLGLEILGQYTAGDDLMQMCYAFEFLSSSRPAAADVKAVMDRVDRVAADGWPCWAYSNHDTVRHTSRWQAEPEILRLMTTLMMCLRGSACIYQGEELGLPEADVPYEALQDPYGIEFWPEFKGRDGCRTPMPWSVANRHAGFSDAEGTWLPVPDAHLAVSVERSEQDSNAPLHHYRAAIALRHDQPELMSGAQSTLQVDGDLLTFTRSANRYEIFCAFNIGSGSVSGAAQKADWQEIGASVGAQGPASDGTFSLDPWQVCLGKRTL